MIGLIDCRRGLNRPSWSLRQPELLEFFDRPLLQHAIEQMVHLGVSHCVVIADDPAHYVQRWGEGSRWGCDFSAIAPAAITGFLSLLRDQPVLVGRGDRIPRIAPSPSPEEFEAGTMLFYHQPEGRPRKPEFTGWAIARPHELLRSCFASSGAEGLRKPSDQNTPLVARVCATCIRTDSPAEFLESVRIVLEEQFPELVLHVGENVPGVWSGRNVLLHPSVQCQGRLFVGENSRIGRGVKLSGFVAIGRDCIIGPGAELRDVCVQPGTYVGRGTHAHDEILCGGHVARAKVGATVKVEDPLQLGPANVGLLHFGRQMWKAFRSGR